MTTFLYNTRRTTVAVFLISAIGAPVQLAYADGGRAGDEPAKTSTPKASTQTRQTAQPKPARVAPTPAPKPATPQRAAPTPAPQSTTTTQAPRTQAPRTQTPQPAPSPRVVLETAPSGQPPAGETRFIPDELIVRFQTSSNNSSRNQAIRGLGITHLAVRTFVYSGVTVHRYRLPADLSVQEAITRLEASPAVVNAQPNYFYQTQQGTETAKLPQFGNDRIELSAAHARTKGANTRVAIIDTAVDDTHSEFSNSNIALFDVTDGAENVDAHGTSIAGILAADAKLTGVAPEAEIISIAAFSADASGKTLGNTWTILEALNVAHAQNANILNLSFAGPADPLLERAMDGAKRLNVLPVAAAGNEGPEAATLFPAGYEAVVSVTATDTENNIYARANAGAHVDIAAPGVDLLVLGNGSSFRTQSGTSMATAYVTGIAALALSANPGTDYTTLRTLLENSTTDLGTPGKDAVFGAGLPNASIAIGGLVN